MARIQDQDLDGGVRNLADDGRFRGGELLRIPARHDHVGARPGELQGCENPSPAFDPVTR